MIDWPGRQLSSLRNLPVKVIALGLEHPGFQRQVLQTGIEEQEGLACSPRWPGIVQLAVARLRLAALTQSNRTQMSQISRLFS